MSSQKMKLETKEEIVRWLRKQGTQPSVSVGIKTGEVEFDCVLDGILVEEEVGFNGERSEMMARGHLQAENEREVREALRFEIYYGAEPNLTLYICPNSWRGKVPSEEGVPIYVCQYETEKQKKRSRKLSVDYIEIEEESKLTI